MKYHQFTLALLLFFMSISTHSDFPDSSEVFVLKMALFFCIFCVLIFNILIYIIENRSINK